MRNWLTRRGLVKAGIVLPVIAAPQIAQAVAEQPDPIFSAIERHRAARGHFGAICDCIDEVKAANEGREVTAADQETYIAADDAAIRAADALMRCIPQTKAGAAAWLGYLGKISADGEPVYHRLVFEALLKSPLLAA